MKIVESLAIRLGVVATIVITIAVIWAMATGVREWQRAPMVDDPLGPGGRHLDEWKDVPHHPHPEEPILEPEPRMKLR